MPRGEFGSSTLSFPPFPAGKNCVDSENICGSERRAFASSETWVGLLKRVRRNTYLGTKERNIPRKHGSILEMLEEDQRHQLALPERAI